MKPASPRTNNRWVYAGPSGIHGKGLFARVDIAAGTAIVEYSGPRVPAREGKRMAEAGNVYIFQVNRREFMDGSVASNLARHANHSCAPNAQSIGINGQLWLRTRRAIAKGEEITYDYGYSIRDEKTPCHCGAACCLGIIARVREN